MEHVFISYVRENKEVVDKLYQELKLRGIKVWLDRQNLGPGFRWKQVIREAIRGGDFFIACFSKEYNDRVKTQMNEEITLAIEELRLHPNDQVWFIPLKLNKCEIPNRDIGAGETLKDLTYVELYEDWDTGIQRILNVIQPKSSRPNIDENAFEKEIDQNACAEYSKGLSCQNEITETDLPEEREKKNQRAFNHYSKALEMEPDYIDARNARGGVYVSMGKFDDAIQDFSVVLKLDPDYFVAYLNRGTVYKTKGEYEQAIKDFSIAIKLRPDVPYAYLSRGVIYGIKGNFIQAIKDYNMAIELKPDYAEAYYNRGVAYSGRGIFGLAIENYTKAIDLNPDEINAYCYRGIVWLHLKKWREAKSDLILAQDRGVDIISIFHEVHEDVSTFEKKNKFKLPEDIALMLTHQVLKPNNADTYITHGIANAKNGEYDLAIADFNKAIELDPEAVVAYEKRGITYYNRGKFYRAVDDFSTVINLKPD